MMIDLLVDKVYVHEDRIELILNYTGTPPKPKRRIDDKPESPEGENLRGSLILRRKLPLMYIPTKAEIKKALNQNSKASAKSLF